VEPDVNELVRRCLAGDELSIRQFVERFQQVVFALCLKMLRHRQDAEDVTQESLLRALRNLDRWDPTRPLLPWLMAITANRCRTALTSRNRQPRVGGEAIEHPAPQAGDAWILAEELQLAIDGLREEYRMCFEMFYLQESTCAEIGAVMKVPEGTVKTWLHRARKELSESLKRRGVSPESPNELPRIPSTARTGN